MLIFQHKKNVFMAKKKRQGPAMESMAMLLCLANLERTRNWPDNKSHNDEHAELMLGKVKISCRGRSWTVTVHDVTSESVKDCKVVQKRIQVLQAVQRALIQTVYSWYKLEEKEWLPVRVTRKGDVDRI